MDTLDSSQLELIISKYTTAFDRLRKSIRETFKVILRDYTKAYLWYRGKRYGVSPTVMRLCYHRKPKVAKKNWSRLEREVRKYERRYKIK